MEKINFYILDSIKRTGRGVYEGCLKGHKFQVVPYSKDCYDHQLIKQGLAKCDAPGFNRTMLVKESYVNGATLESQRGVVYE